MSDNRIDTDEARKSAREAATVKAAEVLKACFEFGGARPVRDIAGEIIDAYEAALKGAGWVIVPREASEGMCVTAYRVWHEEAGFTAYDFHAVWSAMIAASEASELPPPPASRKE